jgi:hypothetical protein
MEIQNLIKLYPHEYPDTFDIKIFFLSEKTCNIQVTRLDSNTNPLVYIYNINDESYEQVHIGSSMTNIKIIQHTVSNITLKPKINLYSKITIPFVNKYLPTSITIPTNINAIFLISSMLTPTTQKFFSVQERFEQTVQTVLSAKNADPKNLCILIEGSVLSPQHKSQFNKLFDIVLELGEDPEVIPYVTDTRNIGHGEMKLLEKGIQYIKNYILPTTIPKHIFKLGARYKLNKDFNINNYNTDKFNFHIAPVNQGYTTGLYSIPPLYINIFEKFIIQGQHLLSSVYDRIEFLFYYGLPTQLINVLPLLGLEGHLSYNGGLFQV